MSGLFALTLAASAALLFGVQPMAARMALPVLGGSPAVWNTSMVFFQAAVLAGYALAHFLAGRCRPRTQVVAFLALVLVGGASLPVAVGGHVEVPPAGPVRWLLGELFWNVGPSALALGTAGPLLQRWYVAGAGSAREPYALYAASNTGSLGALLAYPLWFEPAFDLGDQSRVWTIVYALWGLLVVACTVVRLRAGAPASHSLRLQALPVPVDAVSWRRIAAWVVLAAIPASLLQGCTLFLTTDVASIPLLWVVPLALYLVTFIVAFSPGCGLVIRAAGRTLPFLATALLFVIVSRATQPVALLIGIHVAFLLGAGLVCHGRLVSLRPPPSRLTAFYLALAAGGFLGGAFNALLAPLLFDGVLEYPIAITLACAVVARRARRQPNAGESTARTAAWARDLAWAVVAGLGLVVLALVVPWLLGGGAGLRWREALVFGPPAVAACVFLDRPRRLALGVGAVFAAGLWAQNQWSLTRHAERNFFGITRVAGDATRGFHQIVHGNTVHGRQFLEPSLRDTPLTYYHRAGPLGSIFEALHERPGPRRVGVIGLGAGSMAAYARPEDEWIFFEIDPAVIRVALDTNWFSFIADSKAGRQEIIEGDARLRLRSQPDASFDLLVLDAFSSDAIPVHLLTREAAALYVRKLRPGGLLAAHISNRYLNLEPVVGAIARDAGLVCRAADDTAEGDFPGKEPSHWAIMVRAQADLGTLARKSIWVPVQVDAARSAWSDRRAGVFEAFEWH